MDSGYKHAGMTDVSRLGKRYINNFRVPERSSATGAESVYPEAGKHEAEAIWDYGQASAATMR
jgi:hypothetical protein